MSPVAPNRPARPGFAARPALAAFALALVAACGKSEAPPGRDGSKDHPLVVMLIPPTTGAPASLGDYRPLFDAITRLSELHLQRVAGATYDAAVEAMAAGRVDIAFLSPAAFEAARRRGAVELLAVEEVGGQSVSYAGIFHRKDSGFDRLTDLRRKSLALGEPASTHGFRVPVAMLIAAGLDPAKDLKAIAVTGADSAALEELAAGRVDAAASSIAAYDEAVATGAIDGGQVVLLTRSDPIPSPPIAIRSALAPGLKDRLRRAFHVVHAADGVEAAMLLGHAGEKVERYDADADPVMLERLAAQLEPVTDKLVNQILEKARPR